MKKVCKVSSSDKNILRLLYQNREGLRTRTIMKLANLKERVVYKRLNILKEQGLVENIFPIWRLVNGQVDYCATLIKSSNIFELHNISYIIKLIKTPDWWNKRKNYLIRLKEWQFKEVNFGKANSNPYVQLINENFVIQTYPESIIIIAKKRYYANNPYETIQSAMSDILKLLEWFCERFRFNFFSDGVPHIEVRNNDFNRMNDALANRVKKEKGKFLVELDERRKVWVDMSEPFGKEANYPEAQEILEKVTKDYLIHKPMLNSELQLMVQRVTENQLIFADNMQSHIQAIQTLSSEVKLFNNAINRLIEEVENLKNGKN
jgi:hypothetical protein